MTSALFEKSVSSGVALSIIAGRGLPMMFPYSLLASDAVRVASEDKDEGQRDTGLTDIFAQGFGKDPTVSWMLPGQRKRTCNPICARRGRR